MEKNLIFVVSVGKVFIMGKEAHTGKLSSHILNEIKLQVCLILFHYKCFVQLNPFLDSLYASGKTRYGFFLTYFYSLCKALNISSLSTLLESLLNVHYLNIKLFCLWVKIVLKLWCSKFFFYFFILHCRRIYLVWK